MLLASSAVLNQLPQVGDLIALLSNLLTQLLDESQELGQGACHVIIAIAMKDRDVTASGHSGLSARSVV